MAWRRTCHPIPPCRAIPLSPAAGDAVLGVAWRAGLLRVLAVRVPTVRDGRGGARLHPAGHVDLQLLHQGAGPRSRARLHASERAQPEEVIYGKGTGPSIDFRIAHLLDLKCAISPPPQSGHAQADVG